MSLQNEFGESPNGKKVRYAVPGAGWISQEDFIPRIEHTGNSVITALVTGDQAKAKALTKQYQIPNRYDYDEYEKVLRSGNIDAVYLAVPNSMHRDHAVAALNAGILDHRDPEPDGEEGLADILILLAIEEALERGIPKPIISRIERRVRPGRDQIIRLPALKRKN